VNVHGDGRRIAYYDLFETPGQVNLFVISPGQRTCWHRHQRQTDVFRCIRGAIRVKKFQTGHVISADLDSPEQAFRVLPGWWHGYECISDEPAYLLMYLDRKYDPTDEERVGEDEWPW
jgi:dTDP-4-dehydrorhamnose 3,5-epimerase-like enzyme